MAESGQTIVRRAKQDRRGAEQDSKPTDANDQGSLLDIQPGFNLSEANIKLKGPDPFGSILSAKLSIRGVLKPAVYIGPMGDNYHPLYDADINMIPIDHMMTDHPKRTLGSYVVCFKVLQHSLRGVHYCLLLEPSGGHSEYKRIGIANLEDLYYKKKLEHFEGYRECEFVLV
jgi:hypothetical protein